MLLKPMQVLMLAPTELGFYIMLLAGPLLGLKSDLRRKHVSVKPEPGPFLPITCTG